MNDMKYKCTYYDYNLDTIISTIVDTSDRVSLSEYFRRHNINAKIMYIKRITSWDG